MLRPSVRIGPLTRFFDELLWTLRRSGFSIATSQAIDVMRAVRAVGVGDPSRVREAVAAVIVERRADRARFDRIFDTFFATTARRGTLWERLGAKGFSAGEVDAVRELLTAIAAAQPEVGGSLRALLDRGADLERLLHIAGVGRGVEAQSRLQVGFYTHRTLQQVGASKARGALEALRAQLRDAFGDERADALVAALRSEIELAEDTVRDRVREAFEERAQEAERRDVRSVETTPFTALRAEEIDEVRLAVRRFAQRLKGGARVRARRARRGRIDPHRTLRRALATGGVPFEPARKLRRRERPRLFLVCDVSDSVRAVATFLLEFVYAAHDLFSRTRSFVFVSELGETTELFERESPTVALGRAYGGGVISVTENSNYGRMLRELESRYLDAIDRQTTVVFLGDGRTNYREDCAEVLDRIRARARALLWLCPDARGEWALGDSAMARYAPKCTEVYVVRSARDLEDAARALVLRR